MKNYTNFLRFALLAVLLTSGISMSAYDFYSGGFYYSISSSGVTVENKGSFNTYAGNVTIPEKVTYQGTTYNVVGIGYRAFKDCTGMTSVTIPKTVYLLLNESFAGCTSLTSIVLPSSITSIYNNAFVGCTGLKKIYVMRKTPASANTNNFDASTYSTATLYVPEESYDSYKATAPWSSFTNIKKTNYDFEKNGFYYKITGDNTVSVTYRDTDYDSYSGNVSIPSSVSYDGTTYSVTSIWNSAFSKCSNLTGVTIPNTVTSMSYYVFGLCTKLTTITIPNSVRTIGAQFFYGCSSLTSVTLGSGLTSIDNYAFNNCNALTKVTCLSQTPPTIQNSTFYSNHYSNTKLTVPNSAYDAYKSANYWKNFTTIETLAYDFYVDGIYYKKTSSNTVEVTYNLPLEANYTGSVTIPSTIKVNNVNYNVTAIGGYAFYYCKNLTSVTIPNSVTSIDACAFEKCSGLKSITIPNSVTTLGLDAFASCTGLTSIDIPNSVTKIDQLAFYNCTSMTKAIIGTGVTNIGQKAFSGCSALTSITCLASTPPTMGASNCFDSSTYASATLSVPGAALNTYKSADWWRMFNTINSLPFDFCVNGIYYKKTSNNTVEVTYKELMAESYSGAITIPSTIKVNNVTYKVTAIGVYAFYLCKNMSRVTIPTSVTKIDGCAFEGCSGLMGVVIPNSVTYLGVDAFARCSGLKSITIPNSVTKIDQLAFSSCTGLTSVTIGNGVTRIENKAFDGCTALTNVTCQAITPPAMGASNVFGSSTYNTATLTVPQRSLTVYKSADWWRMFTKIVGGNFGGDPSDTNGDGEVNIADVNAVIDAILSGNTDANYDANGDGEVNIADINFIIDAILNS